jgi:RNA polymerase sigma-70 factor (ECF subfamily)
LVKAEIVELARKAIKGDLKAFEDLCLAKQRDMMFVSLSVMGNYPDAEDAAQEAILKMHKNIRRLKDPVAINVWIERIVRNECYAIFRTHARKQKEIDIEDEDIVLEEENREFLPEAYAQDSALSEKLYGYVSSLSAAKRDAIIMYYYEGLSYKEIAEVQKISEKSVSSNITKARMMLKKKLTQEGENIGTLLGVGLGGAGAGLPATSTVMGKSLRLKAMNSLPDESMDLFAQKWMGAIDGKALPAAGKPRIWNFVVGLIATMVVVSGIAFAGLSLSNSEDAATGILVDSGGREILLISDDCECGHINPQGFEAVNLLEGDGTQVWEIVTEADGAVVFSGDEATVSTELDRLVGQKHDGEYLLRCTLPNRDDKSVILERSFVIGNYSGDA